MLRKISDVAQNIAEAIKTAFQMDVEIVDEKIIRIAATGEAKAKIGEPMAYGTVSRNVIKTNKHVVIESKTNNPLCNFCPGFGKCSYSGGVVVPIRYDDSVIGSLNVVAYDEERLDSIRQNVNGIIDFLYRMSDLMTSKIREKTLFEEQNRMNGALLTLINSIPKGILSIDENGYINHANHVTEKMLQLKVASLEKKAILEVFKDFPLKKVLIGNELIQIELTFFNESHHVTFLADVEPVKVENEIKGAVISLSDYKEVQRSAFDFVNSTRTISIEDVIGRSPQMIEIKSLVSHVAANDSTILITGESGTGKEMFARAIHQLSQRKNRPFISINCGALPETLIESELFGYEKGAFTGADSKGKPGKFELADQGTIFLDEIGTMPIYLQVKLLRVLQTREIDKIGGKHPIPVNIRVIAATNENLEKLVDQNKFREDLYYRLNVIPVQIPPLRERNEDLGYLSSYFIRRYNKLLNRNIQSISKEVIAMMGRYQWPGNVRELENCLEYAINIATIHDTELKLDQMPYYLNQLNSVSEKNDQNEERSQVPILEMNQKEFEYKKIETLLLEYGKTTKAKRQIAKNLGISLATLYRKLKVYDLEN